MNSYAWMEATKEAAKEMPRYVQELCLLDTQIGDGDHGVTIGRGYQSIESGVEISKDMTPEAFCRNFGTVIAANMGGAIGPVYGVMWKAMGKTLSGRTEIDAAALAEAMNAAMQKIGSACQVKQGEKTMFDALAPAVEALTAHQSESLLNAMAAAVAGAEKGCEATCDMVAKKGRARFLGEKTLGHIDAGAFSFVRWMQAWERAIRERV